MLDFSRIEAGRAKASFEKTNICEFTNHLASTFQSTIERAGLYFKIECDKIEAPVYVDHDMWEKIVLNLISNAFKFTFTGGVTVRQYQTDSAVNLEIEDTGTGIPKDEQLRLFERFHRIEGAKGRTHEGTGIGLALVQELVKLHGGKISVESEVNKGSKFIVSIPVGKAHIHASALISRSPRKNEFPRTVAFIEEARSWLDGMDNGNSLNSEINSDTHPDSLKELISSKGARVLLVDDNADVRKYITNLLKNNWQVEAAVDGLDALQKIRHGGIDLVLTDSMMPNLDGLALVKEIRSNPASVNIPVIMLSARAGEEEKIEGFNAGADDYLVKPFVARELMARIDSALKVSKLRNQAKLQEERSRREVYDFFMQVPSPLVVLMGSEYKFTLVNPAYEKLVGRPVLGKTVLEAFTETEVGAFVKLLDGVYKTGNPYLGHELPLALPDENGVIQERVINVAYHPFRESDGSIIGIMAVHQDVTEQKNTEKKLMRAKEDAEKASQLKSAFLANMSHEIRTPLGVIMGITDLLLDPSSSPAERNQFGEIMKRNGQQLSVIISDILDLSKVEAGELKVTPVSLRLKRIIQEVISDLKERVEEKNLSLKLLVADDIDDKIITDPVRVKQIIWNLIGNAIKFTEKGGITISVEKNKQGLNVQVQDTGIGIEFEHQQKLFRPFSQVDPSNTRKYGGTGLGLALSKKLAKTLEGNLYLKESLPAQGSTFVLSLKNMNTASETQINSFTQTSSVSSSTNKFPLQGRKILLVEDSVDVQYLISHLLSRKGAEIIVAENGAEGLKIAGQYDADIVLMDIQMPVMDGYTATQTLRQKGYKKPILALTAHAMTEAQQKCMNAGCTDYLVKPINVDELVRKILLHSKIDMRKAQ